MLLGALGYFLFRFIGFNAMSSGIALNPSTPKEKIIPLLDIADIVLVMSVEPGYCGQSFHKNAIDRVNFFKSNFPCNHKETH